MQSAKPFLKWPGGKSNLLSQFQHYFPKELLSGDIDIYFEPFAGSGALFYHIKQNYKIKKAILSDINEELIITYKVVQNDVEKLSEILEKYQNEYLPLKVIDRKKYFYDLRANFNFNRIKIDYENYSDSWIIRAAQIIFLNKTCFNGLFRLNKKGDFNTPYGSYKNPKIYDPVNLKLVTQLLVNTEIIKQDFEKIEERITANSFIYFDPPYRPLNKTSSFTSYSTNSFEDNEQKRLANFLKIVNKKGVKFLLSNSEPKNEDPEDNFFEQIYKGFNINNVYAPRMINCKGDKRGKIKEIVVTNY